MAALIEAFGLAKHYPAARNLRQALRGERRVVRAVDGIDLLLEKGESVGLVGESGSGKTTVGRLLLKLTPLSAGQLSFEGDFLDRMDRARTLRFRQQAQLVFQNPFDALNPRFSIQRSLAEPLRNTGVDRAEHEPRIAEALRLVKLDDAKRYLEALPHQLSGGQLQRVVLARALVVKPVFLVADEPVSMLDVSVRAGILNLLVRLVPELLKASEMPSGGRDGERAHDRFQISNDPVGTFVQRECLLDPKAYESKSRLEAHFKKYLDHHGLREAIAPILFKQLYERFNVEPVRRRDGQNREQGLSGIVLKPITESSL